MTKASNIAAMNGPQKCPAKEGCSTKKADQNDRKTFEDKLASTEQETSSLEGRKYEEVQGKSKYKDDLKDGSSNGFGKEESKHSSLKAAQEAGLAALGGVSFQNHLNQGMTESQQVSAARCLDQVIDQVAEHMDIIKAGHKNEVLIRFKEGVLSQTEVRIMKTEGHLNIVFNTAAASSLHVLQQNKMSLELALKRRTQNSKVSVSVQGKSSAQMFSRKNVEEKESFI